MIEDTQNNTFIEEDGKFETVIGDEKQPDFFPRIKVKKWDNEVNFSVGVIDDGGAVSTDGDKIIWEKDSVQAVFYPIDQTPVSQPLKLRRTLKNVTLTPYEASSEYELMRHLPDDTLKNTLCISNGVVEPCIILVDKISAPYFMELDENQKAIDFNYIDKSNYGEGRTFPEYTSLPIARINARYNPSFNPYYMDYGLHNIMIHIGTNEVPNILHAWRNSVKETLSMKGVDIVDIGDQGKIGFIDGDKIVKFHSCSLDRGVLLANINISCEYNKCYDFYKPSINKDIRSPESYGLQSKYPDIDHNVVDEIITLFAQKMSLDVVDEPYSQQEMEKWTEVQSIHAQSSWIVDGNRDDVGWWFNDKPKGFEFEIVLQEKPSSNIYPLSIQTKNLKFLRQPILSDEDIIAGQSCDPDIYNSYAVYHGEDKMHYEYETGKAFHIYRPMIFDANKNGVFADMEIDESNNLLNIIIPQDFLDNAVYPIVIDPTLGYTAVGSSFQYLVTAAKPTGTPAGYVATPTTYYTVGTIWPNSGSITNAYGIFAYCNPNGDTNSVIYVGTYNGSSRLNYTTINAGSGVSVGSWYSTPVNWNINYADITLAASATASTLGYYGAQIAYDGDATVTGQTSSGGTTSAVMPATVTWTSNTQKFSLYVSTIVPDMNINFIDSELMDIKGIIIWQ